MDGVLTGNTITLFPCYLFVETVVELTKRQTAQMHKIHNNAQKDEMHKIHKMHKNA